MDHEKLFDEIVGKLNQLSLRAETNSSQERVLRAQSVLQKSQENLKITESEIQQKMSSVESQALNSFDLGREYRKLSEQLETERTNSNKLSSDLAKSLELNLKLQFEIEEVRAKITQALHEEKKHNQYLTERNRNLIHEVDLSEALTKETKSELQKAKDKIQELFQEVQNRDGSIAQRDQLLKQFQQDMESRVQEIQHLTASLEQFENHSHAQNDVLKSLSDAAEKKMVELKMALDKKSLECQDYYSHLQQSLAQTSVLRQENLALKDYIGKISNLQNQLAQAATQQNNATI